jgi:protein phosphatase
MRPGDLYLLCSDGLNAMLGDDEIRDTLSSCEDDPEGACRALVDAANARGGEDNTTVVIVRV